LFWEGNFHFAILTRSLTLGLNGEDIKIYFFVMTLCKSGDTFAKAYLAEDQIAWFDGHVSAFEYFGGVPEEILYRKFITKKDSTRHNKVDKRNSATTA
jgi:transposase